MSQRWYIYALKCPSTAAVRYIGRTHNPNARLATHVRCRNATDRPVAAWVRDLVASNKWPAIEVLQEGVGDGFAEAERAWIAKLLDEGANLLNARISGGGAVPGHAGWTHTPEARAKIAAAHTGAVFTEERRQRISAAKMGHTVSEETRAKIAAKLVGQAPSDETRAKLAAAQRARRAREKAERGTA